MNLPSTLLIFKTEEDAKHFFMNVVFCEPIDIMDFGLILNEDEEAEYYEQFADDDILKFKDKDQIIFDYEVWQFPAVAYFHFENGYDRTGNYSVKCFDVKSLEEAYYDPNSFS